MVYSVKTFNNINQVGLKELGNHFQIDGDLAENPDAYILRSQNLHGTVFPENLKAIARAGAGTNNIPIDEATAAGIVVFNTPGANANAVKEAVLASILMSARDYIAANAWVNTLSGDDVPKQVEAGKKQFAGNEISGKTLGVIGLGAIGGRIANYAQRLGMNVLGYDPYVSIETAWNISHHVKRVADVKEIFANSDYITVHVPLTDETRDTFDSEAFGLMQKRTVVINFARGELVDNAALFEAIEAGVVKRYITDFGTEELLNKDKITVFPHVGGSTAEAELNCAIMAGKTIRQFMETGEITNSVNFPNVHQALTAPYRITLINKNVPNIVAKISTAVSDLGINIDNIINRSKGDYAYTLLDLDETDKAKIDHLVANFEASDNIVRVRLITKK
ncbi:3-phosphoglycerate dehydrogenase family protein [Streptococcus gallolyticus subsp. gallolyticus]|uniref:3-phosphoglycerate dehydrogenase family protein n=1 Tax=Streptococcus gallolyticus TaxID=315405 RepID=UPI002001D706|nr:3-phosphoglycerate dehydrogenase family protein [Streptococcus gallolyticus]MCY7173383.1 3-phosphoglycerate dehydrogenase family protein [Streptococcus gallolyticus subsp. gallolyticus]MCY7175505.1 3-phosphoglycerate dehydrogenase family protein [Streptococcus gallolyticus subsp. gallolyticus]MCY7179960.1 3-phosphoglycerate dehydrogenase family protein [Streptococcus gallolyticus subsp. gallolyticus]MCY7197511.1 3-phosphoglycerate dehydrogenase family protein [Streptococcus gallolyticus subs